MTETLQVMLELGNEGKKYPVTINADEEELVRKAAAQLKEKILNWRLKFSEKVLSDEELMALVALDIAISHLRLEKQIDTDAVMSKIETLNKKLKGLLLFYN
ncbi:MAG: cell division protein ZapA [Tannerella sp.]|jgi:cell division protein ZapA (FtsZ GTPase activity inhibitor)|nr:cell division protein ZapA [Tannerella sp.]